jgi:hypothetical protein
MLPVVHWITRSGWSLVALIWGSFAGVIELIMFNWLTSTHSGHHRRDSEKECSRLAGNRGEVRYLTNRAPPDWIEQWS